MEYLSCNTNEEKLGLRLRQTEHIRGHLWQRYSVKVNQVMPDFSGVRVTQSLVFCVVFCSSLSFLFWFLITPLVSSNFSYDNNATPLPVENAEITCYMYYINNTAAGIYILYKNSDCDYDKQNISVVIYGNDIP
jgi:hypothetical protein